VSGNFSQLSVVADSLERTPLHYAAYANNADAVHTFLATTSGANEEMHPDFAGWTPLHLAAANGSVEAGMRILELDIDTSAKDINGRTALLIAAEYGQTLFLEKYSDLVRIMSLDFSLHINNTRSPTAAI